MELGKCLNIAMLAYYYYFCYCSSYNDNRPDPPNADTVYTKPYTRIPTYLIGLVLGYFMFKLKGKKVKMPVVSKAPVLVLAHACYILSFNFSCTSKCFCR